MEKSVKQKIMDEAVECFNAQGFHNTSLQDIARRLKMSRGNIAYHFVSKDALLEAIFLQMWGKIEAERQNSRSFPSFQNLRKEVALYGKYQRQYAFIFTDSQVMVIPQIKKALGEMAQSTIEDNKAAIAFAIQVGNMRAEPFPGVYQHLAFSTWMLMFFWLPQQMLRGEMPFEDAEKAVWAMIIPHFTAKGIGVFKKHFGEDFLQGLGPAFAFKADEMVLF